MQSPELPAPRSLRAPHRIHQRCLGVLRPFRNSLEVTQIVHQAVSCSPSHRENRAAVGWRFQGACLAGALPVPSDDILPGYAIFSYPCHSRSSDSLPCPPMRTCATVFARTRQGRVIETSKILNSVHTLGRRHSHMRRSMDKGWVSTCSVMSMSVGATYEYPSSFSEDAIRSYRSYMHPWQALCTSKPRDLSSPPSAS